MAVQDSRTIHILWTTLMILIRISCCSNPYLVRVFEAPMENLQKIGSDSLLLVSRTGYHPKYFHSIPLKEYPV